MKKLIFCIILIGFCLSIFPHQGLALTASEVRKQMEDTNDQIEAINKEIATLSKQITKTSQEKNTLANAIKELNLTRSKLIKEKEQIQKKINMTGVVINSLSTNIKETEGSIGVSKNSLKEIIKYLNQSDNTLLIERLLTINTFADFSREYNNILSLNEKIQENITELFSEKKDLLLSKTQKENEQQNLNTLKNNLSQKEKVVLVTQKEKDSLLKATKNKETEYQRILAEQIKKRDAFEKDLEKYEAQLKFILNPKLLPKDGSEVISWPLSYVYITQLFGVTSASKRLYTSGSHSGLDFRAAVGTSVKSVADGTVVGTGDTDIYCKGASFGKWILVKHNNGLSTAYGHLSVISVKKGDKVKKGDIIASSGNTGHSTGPHLHLTVYASDGVKVDKVPSISCSGKTFIMPIAATNAYLDPMLYLPKITNNMVKR